MRNRPTYALQSVDSALRLAQLLQTEGRLRVSEAAARLEVAPSTAHRLLVMLVYRGFAQQHPDRSYGPGYALRPMPKLDPSVSVLRERAGEAMEALVDHAGESANLMALTGVDVLFVATVECDRVLRVGDRAGQTLPAHLTSGGKAMLAALPEGRPFPLPDLDPPARAKLDRELAVARRDGYALNHQQTEEDLTAIGVAIGPPLGPPPAAICLAMPSSRFRRSELTSHVAALVAAAQTIEEARSADPQDGPEDADEPGGPAST